MNFPKLKKQLEKGILGKDEFVDFLFEDEVLSFPLEESEIHSCYFRKVDFSHVSCKRLDFIDCVFENCDLSNLNLSLNTILRCQFKDCKLVGLSLDQCYIKDVFFEECNLSYSLFSESRMKSVSIVDSHMQEARFFQLSFEKFLCERTSLQNLEVIDTKLKDLDFSSCDISDICVSPHNLEGIILGVDQLIDVASCFGVRIK